MKPVLLDACCKAGGAARGYQNAGFHVIGIDISEQWNYAGDEFKQIGVLEALTRLLAGNAIYAHTTTEPTCLTRWDLESIAAIHASPPCQWGTAYKRRPNHVKASPNLVGPVRGLLEATGLPYVIEQPEVNRRALRAPVKLCGSSFGLDVRRHRCFESNVPTLAPPCDHGWQTPRFPPATNRTNLRRTVEVGVWRIPLDVQQRAMGIDWMTREELSEAIPPAYTEWLGRQLIDHLAVTHA